MPRGRKEGSMELMKERKEGRKEEQMDGCQGRIKRKEGSKGKQQQ
jgi:hypothetical protein